MRALRARSSLVTSVALLWQLLAVLFVPAALCCREKTMSVPSTGSSAAIPDCPMHHEEKTETDASCPMHKPRHSGECDCPTLGCSQTGRGFMALFGPVGVLPAPAIFDAPYLMAPAVAIVNASPDHPAPLPVAPPPRA